MTGRVFFGGHHGVCVTDLETSRDFYMQNFGFVLSGSGEISDKPEFELKKVKLEGYGIEVELIQPYETKKRDVLPENATLVERLSEVGINHLAFHVDDIDCAYLELKKEGVRIVTDYNPGKSKGLFCLDPDDNLIEISQKPFDDSLYKI
ncbi:VOC family protein [Candidatus Pacearchaeota archaeon]|nr:VOC family protein [Candidatus Pacearchaeota archaeon]